MSSSRLKRVGWIAVVACCLMTIGCKPDPSYEAEDFIGKWVSGTEYYRYDSDMTGATWDTADDVDESEAQKFKWSIEGDKLTHIHLLESSQAVVPEVYTVVKLTEKTLQYHYYAEKNSTTFTYTRVNP
ncbi:MAG: hypothetical protein IJV22_00375 [Bacteroidales bacterium]|nr:hypothetical protein [Bacteroidales bacterium]